MQPKQPSLSSFPWHIQLKIVNFTDPISRWSLRDCSKGFRHLIDNFKQTYERLYLKVEVGYVLVHIKPMLGLGVILEYYDKRQNCSVRIKNDNRTKFVADRTYLEAMTHDLEKILKNPNVNIKDFRIIKGSLPHKSWQSRREPEWRFIRKFSSFLSKLPNKLKVETCQMEVFIEPSKFLVILQQLLSGTLKHVSLHNCVYLHNVEYTLTQFAPFYTQLQELEQWKQLESVRIENSEGHCTFDARELSRIEKVSYRLFWFKLEYMRQIVEIFKNGEGKCTRWTIMFTRQDEQEIRSYFAQYMHSEVPRLYRIPRSNSTMVLAVLQSSYLYKFEVIDSSQYAAKWAFFLPQ